MAEKKTAKKTTRKPAKKAAAKGEASRGWTAEERAAAKAYAQERKAEARGANDEKAVLEKIGEMTGSDRTMAKRLHAIVKASAPDLSPKTWYGMPAYANGEGKVVCFFTPAAKFKERYATFGFNPQASLDDGNMWPTSWALLKLTPAEEKKIAALVKKAARPGGSSLSRG
ncbi:MAG TPA: DUF1801 domain-containing protein [Actinomycetota bacterium]|nr:DUF1801 domain-containing protein [Actinomycetota bacterium]